MARGSWGTDEKAGNIPGLAGTSFVAPAAAYVVVLVGEIPALQSDKGQHF